MKPGAVLRAHTAVEAVVREHSGRVLSGLIRYLGDFELAQDALQEAVAVALERWPVDGVPDNPPGWIVTAARRKALDRLRRRTTRVEKATDVELVARLERDVDEDEPEVADERLALIFTCCHPALSDEAQVALTLRTLGGLQPPEIARCFLVERTTMQQRIVRAKRKITSAGIPYRVPPPELLPERLSAVLAVLYLIFNEGYASTSGPLVRSDLCEEAIRLARVLRTLMPEEPEIDGLLALMLLQDSRREARSSGGELVTLEEQDRARWDRERIAEGTTLVEATLRRRAVGPYQLQAAIAAVHAEAERPEDTDWAQIVGLYSTLLRIHRTPVVALNRAAAVAMAVEPEAGLELMDDPSLAEPLADYHLLHAARADLLRRLGQTDAAVAAYGRAIELVQNEVERRYLQRRLDALSAGG